MSDDKKNIINLLISKDDSNIEFGMMLAESQKVDLYDFFEDVKKLNVFFKNYINKKHTSKDLNIFKQSSLSNFHNLSLSILNIDLLKKMNLKSYNSSCCSEKAIDFDYTIFPNLETMTFNNCGLRNIPQCLLNINTQIKKLSLRDNSFDNKGLEFFLNLKKTLNLC